MSGLTPLDIATGMPFGAPRRAAPLPAPGEELDAAILPALRRSPCLVSFSGGRDSSAVLASAAAIARREGLPAPIPATLRARGAAASDEAEWQERVVRHLGIDDWIRVEIDDELDVIGPHARRLLRAHGLLWPCNVHFHLPLLDLGGGGSLLTGIGGDELFSAAAPMSWRRRALALGPAPLRRAALARRNPIAFEWLTPAAQRAATVAGAAEAATEPAGVRDRLAWLRGLRYLELGLAAITDAARGTGVLLAHPLFDGALWSAVAARGGFADRTAGMTALFGHLLPPDVLGRRSKAHFDELFFHRHSRAFVHSWDGTGAPEGLVDVEALRDHWLGAAPSAQTFTLLQALWLARDRVEQPLGALAQ
jgi:hypothetical protein